MLTDEKAVSEDEKNAEQRIKNRIQAPNPINAPGDNSLIELLRKYLSGLKVTTPPF